MDRYRSPKNEQHTELSDGDLVTAFLSGNLSAYENLRKRYLQLIRFRVRLRLSNNDDCDDLVQDTEYEIIKSLLHHKYDKREPLRPYIMSIVNHLLINHFRKRRICIDSFDLSQESDLLMIIDPIVENLSVKELYEKVMSTASSLTDLQHKAFRMYYQDFLSHKQIAINLKSSENAIKQAVQRARLEIVKILGNLGSDIPKSEGCV